MKARIQCPKRSIGSRSLPQVGSAWRALSRASVSSSMALITVRISPRTPAPLLLNAAATRPTEAGLGLLVTKRWINWLPMKGPTLGWLNSVSIATFRLCTPLVLAGTTAPRNRCTLLE